MSQFPLLAATIGILLVFFIVLKDGRGFLTELRECGSLKSAWSKASTNAVLDKALIFFGYLLAMILLMLVVGQKLALPIFITLYLLRWGKYNWRIAIGYAAGSWVFMVVFYDRVMSLHWYPSWLDGWLPEILPTWLPAWLFV